MSKCKLKILQITKKGQRNMRLIKVTGGLGNQMFIYAFLFANEKVLSQSAYRPFGHDAL